MDTSTLAQQITHRVRQHDHFCLVYDDPRDRARATIPFFVTGLERGEWCVAVGDREFTESVEGGLEAVGIDLDECRDRGAFAVATGQDTYLASGAASDELTPSRMLDTWAGMLRDASRRGFTACRVAGEPTWALEPGHAVQPLIAYEALVNELFASAPATGLCLYRRGQWPPEVIIDVLRTHRIVVVGDTLCTSNVFYEGSAFLERGVSDTDRMLRMLDRMREATARETALADERDAAVAAGRLKDDFLAALSHELRTPLGSIVGWTAMLRRAELPPDGVRKALVSIERNAHAMTRMVNDLLDMSAILAGTVSLVCRPIDVRAVAREALETIRPPATERRLALDFGEPADPVVVNADADRLRQCVLNLLSNAVKYTPVGGTVALRVDRQDQTVAVRVSDTGVGIAADRLPRIFDRFWRAGEAPTGSVGGLGLGLSITRQLVELHGGRVSVASAGEGRGTAVTIELPKAL